jgi:Protein of unknown function (DUF3592)
MLYWLYTTFFGIGLILAYLAFTSFRKTQALLAEGIQTEAEVIDLLLQSGSEGGTLYRPVFEYHDMSNRRSTFESGVASSPASYDIGNVVKIVYLPNDSTSQRVVGFWSLYRWTIIFLAIASPLLVIGGGYILFSLYFKR